MSQLPASQAAILRSLLNDSQSREALDRSAGVSNAPDAVMQLRAKGLTIHCARRLPRRGGVYTLDTGSHKRAVELLGGAA